VLIIELCENKTKQKNPTNPEVASL